MNCNVCVKSFTGIVPYNQHIESEKHKKKVASSNFFNTNLAKPEEVKDASVFNKIHCSACNIFFDSIMMFQSHSLTLEHVNNVIKKPQVDEVDSSKFEPISSTTSDRYPVLSDVTTLTNSRDNKITDSNDDTIIPSFSQQGYLASFKDCKLCNKQFSGPEPYTQHMVSAMHKKKVDMENYLASPNVDSQFECVPCKKTFSGPIPLQQHMNSDIHRKKLEQLKLMMVYGNQIKEPETDIAMECNSSNIKNKLDVQKMEINRPWFCKICLIQCSGLAPFKQHLAGEAHEKNSRKTQFLQNTISDLNPGAGLVTSQIPIGRNDHIFAAPMLNVGVRNSSDMESDFILPDALQCLNVVSSADLNVNEFYPDVKIDFDTSPNQQSIDFTDDRKANIELSNENKEHDGISGTESKIIVDVKCVKSEKIGDNVQNEINKHETHMEYQMNSSQSVYEECTLCNVKLRNKSETLSHFESLEHFMKKHRS